MDEYRLPKSYDFKNTEGRIYDWWEKNGFFQPTNQPCKKGFNPSLKPFVISIPPPNVTGELHLGHAMFVAMEDLMIRYHRMKGIPTLWVPGSDHAGIATQLQVEKALEKEGLKREDLGREIFEKRVWEWKEKYGGKITHQIRRLGASCDWTRERFTLDEGLSRAVREAFVRLYNKGLIYRGLRLVNWSPLLKTAVSELEVEYFQEPGILYYFKYVLADNPNEFIPVATTRPETILGDTAVGVHPLDERYKKFVGKKVMVPILNRQIPVIADDFVDREFGTGALKITPAHDANDYALAQRHHLEMINILNKDVTMNENTGPFQGMDRFVCRKKIWEDMNLLGLVIKEEPYTLNIPRSQRGGEIIEPLISTQWFVKIQPLADKAIKAVRNGEVKIIPEYFTKVFFNWLENIQDWCISRQLWWGHRIPVWYCAECEKMTISRTDPEICEHCQSNNIHQDEDVLDTWFSSGLWPFSTLGWPEETPDYKYFYPTSILETGYDILFFWVARMIMDGLEFTGKAPFHTVYLHGLIRDENGQKMSKSKGNVIDPLIVMDEMGTDALRFTLLVGSTPGNDMNLSVKKVQANRNFANKIWNVGRFVISALEKAPKSTSIELSPTLADQWITARSNQLIAEVERLFTTLQYGEAGRQIYDFFWSEFADWYIEIAKIQISESENRAFYTVHVLGTILDRCLRLLHPFTPFVTEEIWSYLKKACIDLGIKPESGLAWETGLIIAQWPKTAPREEWEAKAIDQFTTLVIEPVRTLRNIRIENNLTPSDKPNASIIFVNYVNELKNLSPIICSLAHLDRLSIQKTKMSPEEMQQFPSITLTSGCVVLLQLENLVNIEGKVNNLKKELMSIESQIDRIKILLGSEFAMKAPPEIVEKEKLKLAVFIDTAEKIKEQFNNS
jgi:valyl-tRNA synthetase